MNRGDEEAAGGWLGPGERDLSWLDHVRQHRRQLLLWAAISAVFLGVVVLVRPYAEHATAESGRSALTPGTPFLGLSPGLAYDPRHRQIVLFNHLGETWLWSGSGWSQAHPSVSPSGRIGAAMAWDPKLNAVLLFGGLAGEHGQPRDTWSWNGSSWRKLDAGVDAPLGGSAGMAYDVLHREMVLVVTQFAQGDVTTETWSWDGSRWTERSTRGLPGPEVGSSLVFDPRHKVILAVSMKCASTTCAFETLTWDGSRWHRLSPSHQPNPSVDMEILRDPATQRIVLITVGNTPHGVPAPTETWSWDGQDWTRMGMTGSAGGIVYAVPFEAGSRPAIWAFEDVTPSVGAPRVVNAWILGIEATGAQQGVE